ncbi:MAG: flagellar biosynthesis protein FlhB [Lachnospiraceae bacterium]|nr:flagellar biosynthesis protein FlhB [Lachnospiraceae bacterium]
MAGFIIYKKSLLLPYDLQFFQDGPGGEKTEEPTAKKLSDTRKKGQVAKSQELAHSFELLALFIMLRIFGSLTRDRLWNIVGWSYGTMINEVVNTSRSGITVLTASQVFDQGIITVILAALPFMIGGFIVAFFGNALQFKFKISTEPLKPKLSKFNPINGLKRMFSKQQLFNLFLSIVKIAMIFVIAYSYLVGRLNELFILYELDIRQSIALVVDMVIDLGLRISLVYIIIGFADFVFQRWKFKQDVKMTKQEVKDEYKDQEGDPAVKGKQKQRMREASMRRMMNAVPTADVVITNPTHIAVAIKYDADAASAPILVAKGEEYLAQKIKDAAREAGVTIVENKPLARAIYTTVDIDQEIPPELYQAVAEILAMIYTKRGH